jgi:hypothetical protein
MQIAALAGVVVDEVGGLEAVFLAQDLGSRE